MPFSYFSLLFCPFMISAKRCFLLLCDPKKMEISKSFRFIGSFLTFLLAFLVISNFGSYSSASEELAILLPQIQEGLDQQIIAMEGEEDAEESMKGFKTQFSEMLTVPAFRMHSLLKMVGCLAGLIGIVMLRRLKSLGLHLFIGGMAICVVSGIYLYGASLVGAMFTILYLLFGTAVAVYYWSKRDYYISAGE